MNKIAAMTTSVLIYLFIHLFIYVSCFSLTVHVENTGPLHEPKIVTGVDLHRCLADSFAASRGEQAVSVGVDDGQVHHGP